MAYDSTDRLFGIETARIELNGQEIPYTVSAEFIAYPKSTFPTVSTATEASTITYKVDNPCANAMIMAVPTTNPPVNNYDGIPIEVTVN